MGMACSKATTPDQPQLGSISHYHTARQPLPAQPPATHVHYASAFTPSASPAAAHVSTTSSGIIIYPIYDTSSPIASRRVDISGFKVKTSFSAASSELTADPSAAHSAVDADMLKQQMQVLSRLKSHSKSGRHSVTDGSGITASCAESPLTASEVRVA